MVDDYMIDEVLDKIKESRGIEKLDNTRLLIDTNENLPNDITLKILVILMTCVIKNDDKLYPQNFLEESLLVA